LAKLEAKI